MKHQDLIIGTLVKTKGIKGELILKTDQGLLNSTLNDLQIFIHQPGTVQLGRITASHRLKTHVWQIQLKDHLNVNLVLPYVQAKVGFRSKDVKINKKGSGINYQDWPVYYQEKQYGIVQATLNYGAQDILVIKPRGPVLDNEVMMPMISEFMAIDAKHQTITIKKLWEI